MSANPAVRWLLEAGDPAIRELTQRGNSRANSSDAVVLQSPLVQGLLTSGQPRDLADPYAKWTGAHWRLVSLVELGVQGDNARVVAIADDVLTHWSDPRRFTRVLVIKGRTRRCASQEGNAVATACRLGLARDDRVSALVAGLLAWQWPDGGWNCDRHPGATHSSFNETLPAMWGLHEYAVATGDPTARAAVGAAAELLLAHDVVFSTRTGEAIHASFVEPHYPPYWHYDVLQALLVLQRAGFGGDQRTARARGIVADRRRPDGTWRAGRRWWRPPGATGRGVEAVDWGDAAHQMVTLNALRVGAGDIALTPPQP